MGLQARQGAASRGFDGREPTCKGTARRRRRRKGVSNWRHGLTPIGVSETGENLTQREIGEVLGWSRSKVADYSALREICAEAWSLIVATFENIATEENGGSATGIVAGATFESSCAREENDVAPQNGATAPFTEGLLRSILPPVPGPTVGVGV